MYGKLYGLLTQLQARKVLPENISDLIITHTHFDHFNGLSRIVDGRY